tara:strand:- start:183 stop:1655 length:1473 start_codon:yes stop_codon:yes gene_type:complete
VKDAIDEKDQDNSEILKLICPESEQRALLGGGAQLVPRRKVRRQGSNEQWEMDGQDARVEHPGIRTSRGEDKGAVKGGKEKTSRRQTAAGKNAKFVVGGANKPSVFSIFDDVCAQLKGVAVLEEHDEKAHQELYNRLQRNGFSWKPKKFSIEHYAGTVWYDPTGFVEKNKDELSQDIRKVLAECGFELLKKLAEKDDEKKAADAKEKKGRAGAFRKKTVFKAFGESLNALLSQLVERKSNWVRCLKPNQDLRPGFFDVDFMQNQLAYSGTLQVAKVRKSGYSDRKELDSIWKYYSVCLEDDALLGAAGRESRLKWQKPEAEGGLPLAERVRKLMDLVGATKGAYEVGHTLLFMRDGVLNTLNASHRIALRKAKVRRVPYFAPYFAPKPKPARACPPALMPFADSARRLPAHADARHRQRDALADPEPAQAARGRSHHLPCRWAHASPVGRGRVRSPPEWRGAFEARGAVASERSPRSAAALHAGRGPGAR